MLAVSSVAEPAEVVTTVPEPMAMMSLVLALLVRAILPVAVTLPIVKVLLPVE